MTPRDFAEVLLRKAGFDRDMFRILADRPELPDEGVGFHAQQAVEKALKAVLTALGARAGNVHDPARLISQIEDARVDIPDWLRGTASLADFGVTGRYVEMELDRPLDRPATLDLVERTLEWAKKQVEETESS